MKKNHWVGIGFGVAVGWYIGKATLGFVSSLAVKGLEKVNEDLRKVVEQSPTKEEQKTEEA